MLGWLFPLAVARGVANRTVFAAEHVFGVAGAASEAVAATPAGAPGAQPANSEATITVDYPEDGSIFPPEITPPLFLWRDAEPAARSWRINVVFAGRGKPLHFTSAGEGMQIGPVDQRCVSTANKLPELTPEQAAAHTWRPEAKTWDEIKRRSADRAAVVEITGLDESGQAVSRGRVTMTTSKDPVGAPIFYRDVPLMPSEGAKGVVQPLAPNKMSLIAWRIRDLSQPQSRVVMSDQHSCANCHSFSADGKTMGLDVDGPGNDKGLYALIPVGKQMAIRNQDMVHWNTDLSVGKSRVGFMSQVSPDGQYVVSTFAGPQQDISDSYYVTNFRDYRFLQVFYPTRGILAWYSRATGLRKPLPGASDPHYAQTDGVWSPDEKWVIFARAVARDPFSPNQPKALAANDPNETQIQYSLYRVPFNEGRGGVAEPIAGASDNGMSNNFPKVSPDGKWIVFVKCRSGQLMRPDSELYIVPATGGAARKMRCNTSRMNSWHSFSPNGRWLVFSSKSRSPYTQMFLTHINADGNDSPPILVDNSTASNRAVNIPEFVNIPADGMGTIATPATELYRVMDDAAQQMDAGNKEASLAEWQKALELGPDEPRVFNGLGKALAAAGRDDEAVPYFRKASQMHEGFSEAYFNLGSAELKLHRLDDAIDALENAVRIWPSYYQAHEALGFAYYVQGKPTPALTHLRLALDGEPDRVSVLTLTASLLATAPDDVLRDGAVAVTLAEHAEELTKGTDVSVLDTLSAAYAEDGRFDQAQAASGRAIALAEKQGDTSLVERLKAHMTKYKAYQPLRVPPDDGTL